MIDAPLVTQKSWGWRIAAYLFLAGLGSGSALLGIVCGFLSGSLAPVTKAGLLTGPICASLGCLFLLIDLGRPSLSHRILWRPWDSWISRGFFILSGFIGSALILILFWIGPWPLIRDGGFLWNVLGFTAGVFAFLTSIYPAFLLGCSPIPLWNTPILPVLFLVSSASMGTAATAVWAARIPGLYAPALSFFTELEAFLIVLELFLLFLYFHGMKLSETAKVSAKKILAEKFAPLFWGGVVGIGLILPFILEAAGAILLPAFFVLVGGYFLRYVIVLAGIKPPLSVHGVTLPVPDRN